MNILRGIDVPAWLTGLARSIVEAAVFAGLIVLTDWLASGDVPDELKTWAPLIIVGIRTIEGLADQIDESKKRAS